MTSRQRDRALAAGVQTLARQIGALVGRVLELEERLAASAARGRAQLDELARENADLRRRVERLERRVADGPERRPATWAARRLGLSPASVRRLVETGHLEGAALRLPDRERRVWVVEAESVERFERQGGAVGAPGTPNRAAAGRRARDKER